MDVVVSRSTKTLRMWPLVQVSRKGARLSQSRVTFIVPANFEHRFQYSQLKIDEDEKLIIVSVLMVPNICKLFPMQRKFEGK